jgi:hypothetical protein
MARLALISRHPYANSSTAQRRRWILERRLCPVSHDGVIRDAGRNRYGVDRFHEAVVGRKGIHAIEDALSLRSPD